MTSGLLSLIVLLLLALFVIIVLVRTVKIVPQQTALIIERLGRYSRTLEPGLHLLVPFVDVVRANIDLREQVVSFPPQPVITSDNLVVSIDTVIYYQVIDPKSAVYEIANFIQGIEQLTVTTLRNVIGSLDLEQTLTSRDQINGQLRGVLDEATGKWGIRVNRVELKAIDPPQSIQESMEKQMKAERDRRAIILNAEGTKASQILTAEGEKQSQILRAEGSAQARILEAQGQARAIQQVFDAIHRGKPTQKLLAYQYLQVLPQIARGDSNKMWIIPSELTDALKGIGGMLGRGQGGFDDGGDDEDWVDPGESRRRVRGRHARGPGRGAGPGPRPGRPRQPRGRGARGARLARPAAHRARCGCRAAAARDRADAPGAAGPAGAVLRGAAPAACAPDSAGPARRRGASGSAALTRHAQRAGRHGPPRHADTRIGCPRVHARCPPRRPRGHRGRHDQHDRRLGHPHHLPDAAAARHPAGDRQHLQQHRPGPRQPHRRHRLPQGAGRGRPDAAPVGADVVPRRRGRRPAAARAQPRPLPGDRAGAHPRRAGARRHRSADQRLGRTPQAGRARRSAANHERAMQGGVFGAGVYGGYFGAAQGIILMGILGALSSEPIQRLNGYKNVLATIVNGVAAAVFIIVAPDQIDWLVVLLIAIGSTIGGVIGSTVGRRLSPTVLRGVIVVIGLVAIVKLVAFP